jgi:putative tryptophan/tyrosine transport system substrate-binding protein
LTEDAFDRYAADMSTTRRTFLACSLAFLASPQIADAQQASKVYRVGVLSLGSSPPGPLDALREGLQEYGYVERKNLVMEWRFAGGQNDRLPGIAAELVRRGVDCIVAVSTPAAQAAKRATVTIPIVIVRLADPVGTGLVTSFARPGGNITGLTAMAEELGVKRLELIKEVLPSITRVAVMWNAGNPGHPPILRDTRLASERLAIDLLSVPVRGPEDLGGAVEAAARARAGALLILDDVLLTTHRLRIIELTSRSRLPVSSFFREFADAGALVAYGPSIPGMYRRAAYFVDRILRGANPGDIPIEQPTTFELVINVKTAKSLGITIPAALLVRADQIIE